MLAGAAEIAEFGGDVDDAPAISEMRQRRPRHQHRAAQIDRHHPVEGGEIEFRQRRVVFHAGAVHQAIDAAEPRRRLLHRGVYRRGVGDVSPQASCVLRRSGDVEADDLGASGREGTGGGTADAAGSAGNDDPAAHAGTSPRSAPSVWPVTLAA